MLYHIVSSERCEQLLSTWADEHECPCVCLFIKRYAGCPCIIVCRDEEDTTLLVRILGKSTNIWVNKEFIEEVVE